MLAKARGNVILSDNDRDYYRNVYLQSDHWKSVREEKLSKVGHCEKCGTTLSLDVHHKEYKGLYDIRMDDLQVLCRLCHDKEHRKKQKKHKTGRYGRRGIRLREIKMDGNCRKRVNQIREFLDKNVPKQFHNKNTVRYILNQKHKNKTWLSPRNKERQEKFDRTVDCGQHDLNTYISIHY